MAKQINDPMSNIGWDDLTVAVQDLSFGPTAPSLESFKGGQVIAFQNSPGNPSVTFVKQLPHTYKIGTDLRPHIHFSLPTAGASAGAENIKFDLTYSWAEIGAVFPTETTISLTGDLQDAEAEKHSYAAFDADVLNSNKALNGGFGVSSMLICSLTRDNTVADNYADDIYLAEFDFHIQNDGTLGSREEFAK